MANIVTLNETTFRKIYPAFADEQRFADDVLAYWFNQACEIVGNEASSPVPYDTDNNVRTREGVLYSTLCHLLTINYLWGEEQAGATANASQGSVSVGFSLNTNDPAWWNSTKCGAQAWVVLSRYAVGGEYYGISYLNTNG